MQATPSLSLFVPPSPSHLSGSIMTLSPSQSPSSSSPIPYAFITAPFSAPSSTLFPFVSSPLCHRRPSSSPSPSVPTMQVDGDKKGFGKSTDPPKPAPSEYTKRREGAAARYDAMSASGMPEYTVWFRLKSGGVAEGEEEMPWLPVGAISVPRSSQVAEALFEPKTEEDLMKGAIRLYPNLQNEPRDNIEFGYQLREFDDEPIAIAERPVEKGMQAQLRNLFRRLQNPLSPPS